jgi:hypothetical protein
VRSGVCAGIHIQAAVRAARSEVVVAILGAYDSAGRAAHEALSSRSYTLGSAVCSRIRGASVGTALRHWLLT